MTTIGSGANIRGRLSGRQLKTYAPDPQDEKLNLSASNAHIPIVYGRETVPGLLAGHGLNASGDLIVRVVWCMGEIYSIEQAYINNEIAETGGIEVNHYRGTSVQAVDPLFSSIVGSTNTDDLILLKPGGVEGVSYSVFRIPDGDIDNPPKLQAVIQGRLCVDPDNQNDGDPFYSLNGYSIEWIGADGTTPTDLDISPNNQAQNYVGGATITNNRLNTGGTKYGTMPSDSSNNFGVLPWSMEVVFAAGDNDSGLDYLISKGNTSGSRGLAIYRQNSALGWYLSSSGTSWNIASGLTSASITVNQKHRIVVEFTGSEYALYFDGEKVARVASSAKVKNNSTQWQFGAANGTGEWRGGIYAAKLTLGAVRYGGVHTSAGVPYADSGTWTQGQIYTDNSALCFGELATNGVYGLGATVTGLSAARDWCDDLLGGVSPRSRVSIRLFRPRKTSEYLDYLAMYANCFWYNDGSGVAIVPDAPAGSLNPSGQESLLNHDFSSDSDWLKGPGWAWNAAEIYIHTPGTAGELSQAANDFEPGVEYVLEVDTLLIAGRYNVSINGTEIVPDVTVAGSYFHRVRFTADETMIDPVVQIYADDAGSVWVGVASVRRLYWLDSRMISNSATITPLKSDDTPTRVTVKYRLPVDDSPNWIEAIAISELPEVESGEAPLIETAVSMPGVYRVEEAANKAEARLLRLQNQVRVSWVSLDIAIAMTRGSVVQYRDAAINVDILVLVEVVEMIDYGRYRVSGTIYSEAHYPGDIETPGDSGVVPVGAIVMLNGSEAPTGWQDFTAAEGYYLAGAGDGLNPGDTFGSNTHAGITTTTESDGGHSGGAAFNVESYLNFAGGGNGYIYSSSSGKEDAHSHEYSTGSITPNLLTRNNRLIEKIDAEAINFPQQSYALAAREMIIEGLSRITSLNNRYLKAGSNNSNSGNSNKFVTFSTGSAGASHEHWSRIAVINGSPTALSFTPPHYLPEQAGGPHNHGATIQLDRSVKNCKLALYGASADYPVTPGAVIMWNGPLSAPPSADWVFCDGRLGTPDMPRNIARIAPIGAEGDTGGDNTIGISGTTEIGGEHSHAGNYTTAYTYATKTVYHLDEKGHNHDLEESSAWEPLSYVIGFYMYDPNPVASFADVSLLISGGEADGSLVIVDESVDDLSPVIVGAPSYDDGETVHGLSMVRTDGDRLEYAAFDFGRKFTLEAFFVADNLGAVQRLFSNSPGVGDFVVQLEVGGSIALIVDGVQEAVIDISASAGEQFFVALCYDQSRFRLYAGLSSVGTATTATYSLAETDPEPGLFIADDSAQSGGLDGWFAQFRATRGSSRYSAAVIGIPLAPFPTS